MKDLYKNFISRLEHIYGPFNENRKSFKKASNSKIARELCYSDSQFSRLVNESASEGEYQRAIKNVERILNERTLKEKLEKQTDSESSQKPEGKSLHKAWKFATGTLTLVLISILAINYFEDSTTQANNIERDEMLRWIFETSAISPFIKLDDLPKDCNYPCYKYQGKWNLKDTYKIPVFRERNGFHYLATDVNLYTRCKSEESEGGEILEGYEYQKHEIWYDKRELQIDSFLTSTDKTQIRDAYKNLQFEEDPNFVKVAYVHTFFRNEFKIDSSSIARTGKVIGRDVEYIPDENLIVSLQTTSRLNDIKSEVNSIIANRLEDFSRPISCMNAALPDKDFHKIKEGDLMSFNCELTTANAPIKYTKTYVLNDQYIETTCRPNL